MLVGKVFFVAIWDVKSVWRLTDWRQRMIDPEADLGKEWHGKSHFDMHPLLS